MKWLGQEFFGVVAWGAVVLSMSAPMGPQGYASGAGGATASLAAETTRSGVVDGGPCRTTTQKEALTIRCTYRRTASDPSQEVTGQIALQSFRAEFSPGHLGPMTVELKLENEGGARIQRAVYLSIDDPTGLNCLRRELREVNLQKIAPGTAATFSETLLSGAFKAGHYTFSLWIPDADPAWKFNTRHDLLLQGAGVANPTTGLNRLAEFTVTR